MVACNPETTHTVVVQTQEEQMLVAAADHDS